MDSSRRIGLFGGTFDPVHIGHLIVAEWVQNVLKLNSIYFIPNYIHPFQKRENITGIKDRLEMLKLAIEDFPSFTLSMFEIDNKGISYAIDTIHHFENAFPESSLFYLIGRDNLNDFFKWKSPKNILKSAKVVVYDRIDTETSGKQEWDSRFEFIKCPLIEISSSMIRENIKSGKPVQSLLPPSVYRYIKEKNLYID
jgi:nicotinate-nucleotide adenylyltransferase